MKLPYYRSGPSRGPIRTRMFDTYHLRRWNEEYRSTRRIDREPYAVSDHELVALFGEKAVSECRADGAPMPDACRGDE